MRAHRLKTLGCALVLFSVLGLSPMARSQTDARGADAAQQADEHFLKGKALLKAGNVQGAYEEYKVAWELKHTYDIAANLGNLELSLGRPRDAAEHLAFSVRNYALTGTTLDRVEKTKQLLAQARAQVVALTIQVNLDGAEIVVDGKVVGRSPIVEEVFVDPGSRNIEARLVSYPNARATITAEKGTSQPITLKLEKPALAPTATSTATVPPPAPARPPTGLLVGGGVLAAAGLAAGIGLTVAANAKATSTQAARAGLGNNSTCSGAASSTSQCSALLNDAKTWDTFTKAAFASFFVGGAFAVATAGVGVWSATAKPKKDAPAIRVAPAVGQREGGVLVLGSF